MMSETHIFEKGNFDDHILRVVLGYDVYSSSAGTALSVSCIEVAARGLFYPPEIIVEAFRDCFRDRPNPRRTQELFDLMQEHDVPSQSEFSPIYFTLSRRLGRAQGKLVLAVTPRAIKTVRAEFPGYFLAGENIGKIADDLYLGMMPFVRMS